MAGCVIGRLEVVGRWVRFKTGFDSGGPCVAASQPVSVQDPKGGRCLASVSLALPRRARARAVVEVLFETETAVRDSAPDTGHLIYCSK